MLRIDRIFLLVLIFFRRISTGTVLNVVQPYAILKVIRRFSTPRIGHLEKRLRNGCRERRITLGVPLKAAPWVSANHRRSHKHRIWCRGARPVPSWCKTLKPCQAYARAHTTGLLSVRWSAPGSYPKTLGFHISKAGFWTRIRSGWRIWTQRWTKIASFIWVFVVTAHHASLGMAHCPQNFVSKFF